MKTQELEVDVLAPPLRHPLLPISVAFVVGSWVGTRAGVELRWSVSLFVLSVLLWVLLFRLAKRRSAWLLPASLALSLVVGIAACCSALLTMTTREEAVELFREVIDSREDAVIRGRVVTEPSVSLLEHGGARVRFDFKVLELPSEAGGIAVHDSRVRVDWYGSETLAWKHPPFVMPKAGEGWQLRGRMREIETRSSVPITVLQVRGRSQTNRRSLNEDASPVVLALWKVRGGASETLSVGMESHWLNVSIVKAMTLGFRSDIPRDVMDFFKLSGTVHIFAISGLHVAIVAAILLVILSMLPIQGRYRVLLFGPLIIAYTLATGAKPSAVRACLMSLFFFSGPLLGRKPDAVSSLGAAAILILAFNPDQILDLGFIFSFVCAAGIIVLVPVLNCLLRRAESRLVAWMHRHDTQHLGDFLEASGMPKAVSNSRVSFRRWLFRAGGLNMAVSIAAWAASTPITAMFFGRITPISVVGNLAVIPLASLIVITAAFSILFGLISPDIAAFFNNANVVLTQVLTLTAKLFANLPFASFEIEPWSVGAVVLWYGALVLLYVILRTKCS